jgi:transcriptional regulator with XRE-family HTH domain
MKFREALGSVIQEYRYNNNLTLRQMSGGGSGRISTTYLWELENSRKEASSEMLTEVAECMSITTAELVIRVGFFMGGIPDYVPQDLLELTR